MGDTQGFTPTIVGVTNPFFVKIYEKWPHIIAVGKVQQQQIAPAVLKQKPKQYVVFSFFTVLLFTYFY